MNLASELAPLHQGGAGSAASPRGGAVHSSTPAIESVWFQMFNLMKVETCSFNLKPGFSELARHYAGEGSAVAAFVLPNAPIPADTPLEVRRCRLNTSG